MKGRPETLIFLGEAGACVRAPHEPGEKSTVFTIRLQQGEHPQLADPPGQCHKCLG